MNTRTIETDYLVIGAGAAGMAFTDALIQDSDARVVMVDRRATPGGHWNDAYPFVRLHQPALYYGVNSLPLGDELESAGPEAGQYQRVTGAAMRAYYERVMSERLLASGRVEFLGQSDHTPDGTIVSRLTGEARTVQVRKKVVDARWLSPNIPLLTPPPFEIASGVSVIPVNQLVHVARQPERFVIIGAGKTASDACVWLLQNGVKPAAIQWIKPRESWFVNRAFCQPGELVLSLLEALVHQMESAAAASSVDDLFDRLEATSQLLRVDQRVRPAMFKGATISEWEIALLRQIEDVVRLGHVRRIDRDRIELEHGSIPTGANHIYVHCAVDGLPRPVPRPIFEPERITLQAVRVGLVPFNAALAGYVEARGGEDAEKNRLCPPNPFPNTSLDWIRGTLIQMQADRAWSKDAELTAWLGRSRLNPTRDLRKHLADPTAQALMSRFMQSVRPGVARLVELLQHAEA